MTEPTQPTHLRVARSLTYVYDVPFESYGCSPKDAKEYEMALPFDQVEEVLSEYEPTRSVVTVGLIYKGNDDEAREVRTAVEDEDGDVVESAGRAAAEAAVEEALRKAGLR